MKFNDIVFGSIFILIAGWMIRETFTFPGFPGQNYGPDLFPRIIAGGIIMCSVLLIFRGLRARAATGAPWVVFDDWTRIPKHLVSFLLIIAAMIVYILVSETLGFIVTAILLQLGLFLWFSVRPLTALAVAVAATAVVQYGFVNLLRVPLPRGLLDAIL